MATTRNTHAREYLRVSKDASGHLRSVDEQHAEAQRLAEAEGWTLGEPYAEETAVSASRYATKTRDGFASLVDDLEQGRFDADILVLWEPSRGSRRISEWARLLELLEERGVGVHIISHGRAYDLTNPRDRRSLHEDGVDAEYESGKASMRIKRSTAANAAQGKPFGKVPYGYVRRYDPVTRQFIAQEPDPTEAPVVRELYERLQQGHSLRAIAKDLTARGVRTRSGRVFTPEHLRGMAIRSVYAGLRTHKGTLYEGVWPGLVDRATWYAVQRRLSDPARVSARPGRGKHLLTMIARCDVCGGPLSVTYREKGYPTQYQCRNGGHVRIDYDELDELAEGVIVGYLARDDVYEQLTRRDETAGEQLQAVRDELADYRARLEALADDLDIDETVLARRTKALRAKITELEGRERELSTPPVLHGLIAPGKDVARRWEAAPMSTKREVAGILLSPDVLGELRAQRRPPGSGSVHVPAEERVRWNRERSL